MTDRAWLANLNGASDAHLRVQKRHGEEELSSDLREYVGLLTMTSGILEGWSVERRLCTAEVEYPTDWMTAYRGR